jgi:hypothetical protein
MQSPSAARFPLADTTNLITMIPDLAGSKTPTLPKSRSRIQTNSTMSVLPISIPEEPAVSGEDTIPDVLSSDWVPNYENLGADDVRSC